MATNYPTGLDTDGDLPTKSSGNVIPSAEWNRITDAIQALQAKVGITGSETAVQKALLDAKGDLLVASAADTVARLAVGTDTHVLTADAAQGLGVKWAAPPATSGDLSASVAFSGEISPTQLTGDVSNYNPTGLSTASTLRLSSDARRTISGIAGGADGRVLILHNIGTFDIVLKDESGDSTAGNRFALAAAMNIKAEESAVLQYDSTSLRWRAVAGIPDTPPSAVLDLLYVATWGSDLNDGRSWKSAFLTLAAAIAALGGAGGQGDIYFGPGSFTWADTIILGQGIRLHGKGCLGSASGGTDLLWSGADDGRDGIVTSSSSAADWTQGLIENIRFIGSGIGMSGGGTCVNIRNPQNNAKLSNVRVVSWDTGIGINVTSQGAAPQSGYPGFMLFENVWVSGSVTGWRIESPMTNLVWLDCGSDPQLSHGSQRSWLLTGSPTVGVSAKAITSSSQSGTTVTFVCTGHGYSVGHFVDISGVNVDGYNGQYRVATVPDADNFTVTNFVTGLGAGTGGSAQRVGGGDHGAMTFLSCKTESGVADANWQIRTGSPITLIGCSYFEQTGNAGGVAFDLRAHPFNGSGDLERSPRVKLINCVSQGMEYVFKAHQWNEAVLAPYGYLGGRFCHYSYSGEDRTFYSEAQTTKMLGAISATGDITPAQITANENNYAPTGFGDASVLRLSTDASRTITGLAGGADGRVVVVCNVGSFDIVLADESASSTSTNRFFLDTAITLIANQNAILIYDGTTLRWRCIGLYSPVVGGAGSVATDAIWDVKGDLAGGTGANTAARLAVGADDTILMADAAQSTGLKWVASGTPSTQAFGDSAVVGTADTFTRGDHKHAFPADPVTTHAAAGDPHTGYVLESLVDAKGDLIAATGADAVARVAVGTDFLDDLIPDSTVAAGVSWGLRRSAFRPTGSLYETFSRRGTLTNNSALLASQRLQMIAIELPSGLTITSISFRSSTTALVTGVNQLFGLYRQSDRVLLRGSVDDTSTAWAANTVKTLALTSTFVTAYSGAYYLGILVNATTVPSLLCVVATAGSTEAPLITGTSSTGVTALPDPAGSITMAGSSPWAWVS